LVRKGNVRWDLSVPEEVDRHLRSHLARSGCSQKGGISEAVAEAVVEWMARHPLSAGSKVPKHGISMAPDGKQVVAKGPGGV
jgi:hypothetical protein